MPHRVLLVEDTASVARMLRLMLERHGCAVRVAVSGADTWAALEDFSPTLALIDYGLPDIEGADLARRLRNHLPNVPLVGITGGEPDDDAPPAASGFDRILGKPVPLARLAATLAAYPID